MNYKRVSESVPTASGLQDFKELKVQWNSAAEYFELAYTKGDRKQM